ncbi:dihydroneopterin aldolase [Neogemmobacter tilapiae]|uniref:Diguanylate cyclase n=1 Tax=Neogemmobacter tilapiae TaxID=875041 RepID=A0A918TGY1_9RHOB|nr:dihydroneopterin aldolase [Gemmobacter tilapiae]GHC44770.1 diguanylate cyclase [Gemmobacter tilapiae]
MDQSGAFAHPEDRLPAAADRISLRDHIVSADIGAFQGERGRQQRLRFNVVVELAGYDQPLEDDVDRILSYDRITEAIAAELAAGRLNLLETLAEGVAARILAEPQARRLFLRIEKLDVGPYALGVEIERRKGEAASAPEEAPPAPLITYLDNDTIGAADLSARIDALVGQGAPLALCVGMPEGLRPVTGNALTQRRVDLLAMEQNAWVLAARDGRCVVVESATEIDWALRRGRVIVWAPSKLVLDHADAPKGADGQELALWLAEHLKARALVIHGPVTLRAESRVPFRAA